MIGIINIILRSMATAWEINMDCSKQNQCGNKRKKVVLIRRGQSTLEYSILIAIIVAAIMAMGAYVRRAVQANLKMVEEQINDEMVREPEIVEEEE